MSETYEALHGLLPMSDGGCESTESRTGDGLCLASRRSWPAGPRGCLPQPGWFGSL